MITDNDYISPWHQIADDASSVLRDVGGFGFTVLGGALGSLGGPLGTVLGTYLGNRVGYFFGTVNGQSTYDLTHKEKLFFTEGRDPADVWGQAFLDAFAGSGDVFKEFYGAVVRGEEFEHKRAFGLIGGSDPKRIKNDPPRIAY